MTISAKIIADSINSEGVRLTTMQLRYPRFIHAEFMTHRVFSRNASSSRAIPVKRLIDDVLNDTAMPIHWGKNQPGMQAREEHEALVDVWYRDEGYAKRFRDEAWFEARDKAIDIARSFDAAGYHKQIVNRLLEPFSHINVVVTATDWDNFYELRRHPDAQPEIKALADAMWEAQQASTPEFLRDGKWHLPYVDVSDFILPDNPKLIDVPSALKVSVARCARVSYLTHDGKKPDIDSDLALYDRLVGSVPLHASPAEHQARAGAQRGDLMSNFDPTWYQYRKILEDEYANKSRKTG